MKIKTSELTGTALDWAVARAFGHEVAFNSGSLVIIKRHDVVDYFDPSTNWGWGGPIIDSELIALNVLKHQPNLGLWMASSNGGYNTPSIPQYGPTPLIAAMRCLVASRFGDEVDVPEELLK